MLVGQQRARRTGPGRALQSSRCTCSPTPKLSRRHAACAAPCRQRRRRPPPRRRRSDTLRAACMGAGRPHLVNILDGRGIILSATIIPLPSKLGQPVVIKFNFITGDCRACGASNRQFTVSSCRCGRDFEMLATLFQNNGTGRLQKIIPRE